MLERKILRKSFDGSTNEADAFTGAIRVAADGDNPQASRARRLDHFLRTLMIGRNHRRAIRRNEIAEQPQLGGEVMRHIRMVIHVVARKIGKTAGGDAYAVEPELVEPVRGRLEGEMRHPVARDFVELPVQRDRVRRRQRAVDRALGRNEPDGADAGGSVAEPFPDLAREGCDRRLAAGPGHRRYCRGLTRIKSRRRQRQRAAWI